MVHCNKKTRRSSGFTMVELMVVLAIMAILAALVGGGLIAYTRLARFEKNEANARTLFQTAQIALTRRDTAGELDDFRQKVLLNGQAGAHFDPAAQKADELNKNIYALYYDKVTDDDSDNELLRELLGNYIYDDSLLNAAICVEIDAASGQVYSVFYDTNADKLRFGKTNGATNIYDRSYDHRRHDSLVGYYSAEDRVNVVELQQTKLKVKNPRLSNTETLTLSWGGDVTRDTQVQYVATAYKSTDTGKKNPLFEIEVELPAVKTNEPVPLKTRIYAADNETPVEKTLYYPLSYNKGNFVLTLDAMASADLLRSCENDSGEKANSISVTDSSLYSITRLMSGGPQDFYVTLQAKARDDYSGSYTPSTPADTNVENSLFAKEATATEGNLTYFRHLYNLRWADNWASGQTADYTLAAQSLGATGLNWTGGSVTVYCPAQGKNFPPEAKVPSAEEAVAWPTILTLPKNVTLDGGNITIMNLQLRGSSVSRTGRQGKAELLDRYIGLVGENNGTIQNMTLRDADVQVNVEIVTRAKGTLPLTGTTALKPLDTSDSAYRDIRAVGALCGVNTGTLEKCTLTHGKNNAVSAQVLAMLPFDDTATATARTNETVNGTTYYANEPRGIGGLVGVAIPKNGQTQKISTLTVDANVTVAGLLQDKSLKDADETLTEQARYAAAASGENSIWRSIGVGGVVGTMDAANLKLEADPINKKTITNKAAVIGSAFTGGVVGNLYNSSSAAVTLTGLQNEGTVSVGANYLGSAEGENSRVLGQFFGGIAGYCKNITLSGSTSTTRRDMTETQLKTAVKGGYAADGALTDDSPLKGDFVGGLVGFASGCKLENCTTQKGYVLGRCFVGGMAGGFSGSQLKITGGSNSSTVLGNRYVGGVVSVNGSQSTVSGVTNSGLVAGLGKNAAYVGGIAGLNDAEWGSIDAANTTAIIKNCVSSMASDTATNSSRSALLQALSTYEDTNKEKATTRADYVGGLVGRNGKNAVLTWDEHASTVQIGAVICGNDFVGGLVGCNDATAKITNTSTSLLTVSGEVTGGKAVGGMIGLNLAPALPAADIKVTEISGTLCVGGVIGANMPVAGTDGTAFTIKETAISGGKVSTFTTTAKAGRIKADGLAGGIIGYNCLLASAPNDLTTILPTVARDTGLVTVNTLPRSDKEMTLNGAANQFNLEVNAYVGGIVGYNDAETRLTIRNATNGSDSNAASVGSLKMRGETGILGSGVSLPGYNDSFNYNDYVSDKNARGSMAGGIIGCVTQNTTLEGCTNYGIVSHKSAAGGIAGWNGGSIKNCSTYATLGTQQDGYAYLGGIVGINNGTVTDSAPAASITVRGRYIIGGVAGLNLTDANITYNTSNNIPVTVQANECAGGVAGVNCGNIVLGSTTLRVNITAESYAGGIAGSNNMRNNKAASIAGGNVTGTVTATKNYAGGAAGANYANITDVTLIGGACVRANDQFAGGIAGSNRAGNGQNGTITGCTNNAGPNGNNYTVYATNGNAGGIAGSNESGAQIINASVDNGVKIGVAKCDAAAIAANNFGIITGGSVGSCDITFAGESIGAVTAINNEAATISGVTLDTDANIAFHGPATNVGGIAGKNAGTIGGCKVENPALALSGLTARADSISLGGAAGVNVSGATISGTNVALNITDNLDKYKNLGGVAGENAGDGTLLKCTYQGALGKANTTGAANVLDTVGGIVGLNNGEVNGCSVPKITLQVMGASGLSDSQTYAEKLKSASSVGGIAGRNNSTITSCYVATAKDSGSIITARYGFVGGVAGANNGSISSSGSGAEGVTNLVKQVDDWFTNSETNDMISKLKGTAYNNIKGVDTVSKSDYGTVYTTTGLSQNDLLVGLRGTTATNGKSSGYLGGVAGFNTVNGTITGAATGKWFVYGNNTTVESKIGGMIGMNEATGKVKLLVNCAAVRRFTRTDGKNDDDTTHRNIEKIAYVGGVIGVQQNTTDDKWVISECVNLGTVFDSGSNYIGGIIASWLKNGGTIEKSFNFGSLSTNTNSGSSSGTVGGIVGFFDQPTPGGTANILSCQNHGDILCSGNWEGDKKHGANDVAGILGKVVMADGTNDYLRINIVDCVNGDVTMQCESLAAGIMGWLGPYGDGGTKIPDKVEVYIDRCRNYATDVTISLKSGDINLFAGICGNRGNGSATSASTTVTNCFALYKNTVSSNNAPIAMNRGSENIVAYGNYFMDENSFEEKKIAALLKLKEKEPSNVKVNGNNTYGESCGDHYKYGTRLYAGIDNSIKSGNSFFAAGMMFDRNLNTVDTTRCYIIPAANEKLATIFYKNPKVLEINEKDLATILLWYGDADNSNAPSMKDITDDLIQNYYTQVLDKRGPGQVSNLTVTHKNDSSAVYGRYEVTWTAAATKGIFPQNEIQNVSHYLVTLYKVDGNSKTALPGYQDIKVYGTRYLFDADDALANAIGTGQFCVGVKAVNGTTAGEEVKSTAQYFVRPLPTPKLEIRLKKQDSNGQPYGQYLVLTNASDYENASDWKVTAYLMNQSGTKITLNASTTEALITNGLGSATRLRATATPGAGATGAWMESARYDEEIGIPKTYYSTGDKGSNSGLVHGTAVINQPVITGSTADDLSITVTLQFTANTIFNTVPNYRVMLVGKYTGDEQISNAAEDTTATNAQPLKGQYVTLAALEKPVYSSGTEFVLSNLPAVVFDGSYTDLKVISVPIDAGYPQVVTRWEITADEALKAIGEGNNNPVSWNNGIEIVRGADGKFSYYHLTPLQFFASQDSWYDMAKKQIRKDDLNLKLLKAPTVSKNAVGKVSTDNKLNYAFTWTQYTADGTTLDTTEHAYDVTLYGLLTEKDSETSAIADKEKIELKDGVSLADKTTFNTETGTYTLTLCVDDDLASGSWRYDKVRLHVTRKPDTGDTNAIGLAGEADCAVKQRLSAVGQVNSIMRTNDNSANALNYDITWPASADAKDDATVTYTLYAEKLDGKNWMALADWPGITKNSCTVDLEKYQGATLRFYVVANAVDESKYCSPNGEYSNLLVVEKRLAAPEVTAAKLSYQTPSQTQFLTKEKLTLTVQDASSGSYYYMGYLFKNGEDYKQIAALANSYQHEQTPDDKATCLKNLTDALNDMLTDTAGRVLRLLPEGRMDGGAQAETTENGAAFALGDESFTMKPEYAGYWLLPALRSMSTDGTTASSNWYYYVADGTQENPTQMQLPKIKLDAPAAVIGNVEREETVGLYDNPECAGAALETTTLQLSRRTVEWPLGNLYDDKDAGTVRSLTNVYQFTVTPVSASKVPYTVKVWVNDREYTDDDGKLHPIGEIVKVEKTVTLTDGDGVEETLTQKIEPTVDEAAQRVWYDLSLLPTVEKNEDAWKWSEWKRQTTRITGTKVENTTKAYYAADVYPMLEVVKNSANEVMLRVTLPDLFKVYMDTQDTLQKITATLTVQALPYEDTAGKTDGKTAESEPSAVELNEADTASQTAEEAPYSEDSEAEDTVSVQAWLSLARAVTESHPTNQTPETAADAETIQPPAA
ncbi:MAG: prepilin-type N-terminal cleavage/methylation domain-containing protein [Gemmiger sp.]|uniref:prepilin-type N-terminal cleavage/methylation domain-containing protein n=1 Tax=Gemmiger sp. TaxID=2049027 RepID=UPI002E78406E|nr:prepilin-type N-terminal cleavage/methylation domain-containing protein [Gemmiger sp.]MEE1423808.1 prepilin-type N-terminal cleavage/methylation domain-containing protein [Gemmiger sp.]